MITLDNGIERKKLSDFGFRELTDHDNPSGVSFDRKLQYIPGRDSPWDFGVEKKGSEFFINCKCLNDSESITQDQINDFNAFAFDMYRQPRELKMWFDYEKDKFLIVQLKESFSINRSTVLKSMSLPFISLEGKKYALSSAYDPERLPEYDKVQKGDRYKNSQSLDWIYTKSYSGFFNYAPYVTTAKFVIKGTIKKASITHLGSSIKLTLPDMANGTMIVDTSNETITLNGKAVLSGSNHEYFEIIPCKNGFLFQSEKPNAKVTFDWLHEF